jgi:hypothetical protein
MGRGCVLCLTDWQIGVWQLSVRPASYRMVVRQPVSLCLWWGGDEREAATEDGMRRIA